MGVGGGGDQERATRTHIYTTYDLSVSHKAYTAPDINTVKALYCKQSFQNNLSRYPKPSCSSCGNRILSHFTVQSSNFHKNNNFLIVSHQTWGLIQAPRYQELLHRTRNLSCQASNFLICLAVGFTNHSISAWELPLQAFKNEEKSFDHWLCGSVQRLEITTV